jgi:hypothetical protein
MQLVRCVYWKDFVLFVDSPGEVSEETAVQNGCHMTGAHRGGASHVHISAATVVTGILV